MNAPFQLGHGVPLASPSKKHKKQVFKEFAGSVAFLLLRAALSVQGPKRITAMVRVKSEEEFLYPTVKSIVDQVDEVVLIDNLSTDGTPAVIRSLQREYPSKVRSCQYHYELRKRGKEHWELTSSPGGRSSPHLSTNYNNWCLQQCTLPYILKWDGDMIATEAFSTALESWRRTAAVVLKIIGANVHADRRHLLGARTSDKTELARHLSVPQVPSWISSMSYTYAHPQLFPKFRARFGFATWWTDSFSSPFLHPRLESKFVLKIEEPCFLHLKFCKRDPYSDYSPDFLAMVTANLTVGPELRSDWIQLLRHWKV